MNRRQPPVKGPPQPELSGIGKVVALIAIVVTAACVAYAAFTGLPIPGTDIVIHSVAIALILGLVPGIIVFASLAFLLKLCGLRVFR